MEERITKRSSAEPLMSIIEAPFRALEIGARSMELNSVIGIAGKFNSMRKASPSGTFLAVKIPDSVTNSIMLEFTKPLEKSACEAASVA